MSITVWDWFEQRSFHHRDFSALADQSAAIHPAVTLILPASETAGTIGPILDTVASLNERTGLVDQILVIDADSADGTADVARAHGAEVYSENELLPEYGPAQGKGDAMWRALSVARGDVVMFADADTHDFGEHFLYGTLGPLLMVSGIQFAKAAYRRPFSSEGRYLADGGGRVTELTAKPLLNFFFPELTGFVQPLAGEFAASRDLLLRIPFLTGYGVEIAILIDVLRDAGLPAMAQVDLGSRQNRHQPLWDLTRMSSAVLRALARRVPALENAAPAPGLWGLPGLAGPQAYLHAVATTDGLRLDEHLSELPERPPMGRILTELPAYQAGMWSGGNSEELYAVIGINAAPDVSAVANLSQAPAKDVVSKKLVANLVGCPTLGAPSRETQANPLLDNYEGMTIIGGPGLAGVSLISDDNFSATQFTRVLNLLVKLP